MSNMYVILFYKESVHKHNNEPMNYPSAISEIMPQIIIIYYNHFSLFSKLRSPKWFTHFARTTIIFKRCRFSLINIKNSLT